MSSILDHQKTMYLHAFTIGEYMNTHSRSFGSSSAQETELHGLRGGWCLSGFIFSLPRPAPLQIPTPQRHRVPPVSPAGSRVMFL
eukprot:gene7104-5037_t